MIIRKTEISDINKVMVIFNEARKTIAQLGINQWQDGYPSETVVIDDISLLQSHVVEDGEVCATFALLLNGEPTYDKIYDGHWLSGDENKLYLAIHRVAISVASRGKGIAGEIIKYAAEVARNNNKSSLRIDTHEGNIVMRKMLEKNGFSYCGIIYLENGDPRVAYEKLI